MVLVRIAYAADLPTPDEVSARFAKQRARQRRCTVAVQSVVAACGNSGSHRYASAVTFRVAIRAPPWPRRRRECRSTRRRARRSDHRDRAVVRNFEELVTLAAEKRDLALKSALERDVRLVRFEDGRLEIALEASAPRTLTGELSKKLSDWTGRRWMVIVSAETGGPEPSRPGADPRSRAEGRCPRRSVGTGGADSFSGRRDRERALAGDSPAASNEIASYEAPGRSWPSDNE